MGTVARICEAQRCDNELVATAPTERQYCSSACRQAAYRDRLDGYNGFRKLQGQAEGLSDNYVVVNTTDEHLGNLSVREAQIRKRAIQLGADPVKAVKNYRQYLKDRSSIEEWAANHFQSAGEQ